MWARLSVIVAAVLFSTGGAAVKSCDLSSLQIASYRCGCAAIAVFLMLPGARRKWTRGTWMVGIVYATMLVLYVLANKLTTAANTIFLQGTAPLYILLLSPFLLDERIRLRDVVFMVILAIGGILFFTGEQITLETAPDPMKGNILALGAGVCWGLTIMGLRWLSRVQDNPAGTSAAALACGNLIAFVAVLPFTFPVPRVGLADWLIVVYLGVVQIALAYVFLTKGLEHVGALEVSLILLTEPVLNPLWAWLIHDEITTRWAQLGGAIIILSTAAKAWIEGREARSIS